MTKKIQQNVLWAEDSKLAPGVMEFLAGEDVLLDRQLLVYDIQATQAHIRGLSRINIFSSDEATQLVAALDDLASEFLAGEFILDERFEDGHSAIEAYLTERFGDLGKKIHTGRSRNDQILVATRLYLQAKLKAVRTQTLAVAKACLQRAQADELTPMPGYTHLQPAMPSSVGLWMGAFAEAMLDNADWLLAIKQQINISPLGAAAGFGTSLPLDRQGVAKELGFERVQINAQYVQNSRGKFELMALQGIEQVLLDVRRLAWDLSLFSTAEFGFVKMGKGYSTGSSIMPNKSNPDVVELLRGAVVVVQGAITELQNLLSLPSGYQRDLQLTKAPLLRAMNMANSALGILPGLIAGLEFNRVAMLQKITPEMFATDRAMQLVETGLSFRAAYLQMKSPPAGEAEFTPGTSLAMRLSAGGSGKPGLQVLRERLLKYGNKQA
ncbi:MAG: argininosuccinate lyase [Xanthomonadales bacterium]|nr:argininosuccinate lyase [Xanthomonadales bacterium]